MKICKVKEVKTPTRGTSKSAGLDFYVPVGCGTFIEPHSSVMIPSGIKVQVPKGYALIAFNKSSIASKKGLIVGACVIDEDFQGEIIINLINVSNDVQIIESGDKIVQFLLVPIAYENIEVLESVDDLFDCKTERGEGGFGSTGNN